MPPRPAPNPLPQKESRHAQHAHHPADDGVDVGRAVVAQPVHRGDGPVPEPERDEPPSGRDDEQQRAGFAGPAVQHVRYPDRVGAQERGVPDGVGDGDAGPGGPLRRIGVRARLAEDYAGGDGGEGGEDDGEEAELGLGGDYGVSFGAPFFSGSYSSNDV